MGEDRCIKIPVNISKHIKNMPVTDSVCGARKEKMSMSKRCEGYVGVTCVDGSCPNILADDYPEYDYERVSCDECGFNNGCEDCAFYDDDLCVNQSKRK